MQVINWILLLILLCASCGVSEKVSQSIEMERQRYLASHPEMSTEEKAAMATGDVVKGMSIDAVAVNYCFPSAYDIFEVVETRVAGNKILTAYVPKYHEGNAFKKLKELQGTGGLYLLVIYDGPREKYRVLFRNGQVVEAKRMRTD